MACKSTFEAARELEVLARRIDAAINGLGIIARPDGREAPEANTAIERVVEGARILFSGVEDVHTPQGLAEVARRYVKNSERLAQLTPRLDGSTAPRPTAATQSEATTA